MTYCTDTDLLFWEPDLAVDALSAAEVVHRGSAVRSGTMLRWCTAPATTLSAGMLVVVDGATHPIACAAGSSLTFSPMLRRPSDITTAHELSCTVLICTFEAHRVIASRGLDAAMGVRPGEALVMSDRLHRIAALATLQVMSAQLSIISPASARWGVRREVYARLLRRELRTGAIGIDTTGDGRADVHRVHPLPAQIATAVLP